ncbi:hypothetical protein [Desulfobacula sp.]|uniref:hypothetical protein n=1 Tax=Desulfobacula sp. TaxID=2593537 RepID=UPI0025C4BE69|nr:hypothetical protein [Desulfobacula sp.]MBC2705139.1 PHP domain-containing protein [Desulfobacula sp.]
MNIKYSNWQRIDLHIHTDWSKKTKNNDYTGTFSVKTLHEKLKEEEVQIFSLTDHNIINLPAYKEYYENYNSENDPLLLLGIELDIERNYKTYHSLLIFNYSDYENAKDINKRLEDSYKEKKLGIKSRKLNIDEIINIFPEDDFFFIPHAGNTASIVKGYKGEIEEAQKMLILLQSPLEKVKEKKRQIYNDNFDKILHEAFREKDDYAYIEFSDNHNIERYPCAHKGDKGDHDFYYIKGSKNYETLRLAFIDPKSRIKSTSNFKIINQINNCIETLEINSSTNIADSSLDFSPHLNVIVGGRSSGKSLLLDILNRSIDTLKKNDRYDSIVEDLKIGIKSKYDENSRAKTSIDTSIVQINQGDIVNYFENNKLEDLAKKTGKIDQYNDTRTQFLNKKSDLEKKIEVLHRAYKDLFDSGITEKTILHDHTLKKFLSGEFLIKADIPTIKKSHNTLEDLSENEELLANLIEGVAGLTKSEYFSINEEELIIIKAFENLIQEKKEEIDNAISMRNSIDDFLDKVDKNIQAANSALNTEGQEKAKAQESIKKMVDDIGGYFKTLVKLKNDSNAIEEYNCTHKETIDLNSESKLCLEIQNEEKISGLIMDGIKNVDKTSLYLCLLKLLNSESSIKNFGNNEPESLKKKIRTQLTTLLNCFDHPDDYLEYKDGSNSKNNSPGYNSEKYLQVILNNPSSSLILIDQPEDNLGNKFISEQLVDLIRDLKFKKQLFLVTHNPAIVVYGDAESIILAKNDDNKISYSQIKLENEASQKDICSILDGGEYIFDNRSKKYNIQKLLNKGL